MNTKSIEKILLSAIQDELDVVRERLIQKAVSEYESEIRKKFVACSLDMTKYFEVCQDRDNIVITLKNKL